MAAALYVQLNAYYGTDTWDSTHQPWLNAIATHATVPFFTNNVGRDRYHLACASSAYSTPVRALSALHAPPCLIVRLTPRPRGHTGWIHRGHRRPLRGRRPS